jgi:hypothetical protein
MRLEVRYRGISVGVLDDSTGRLLFQYDPSRMKLNTCLFFEQALIVCLVHRGGGVGGVEFAVDVFEMVGHRVR